MLLFFFAVDYLHVSLPVVETLFFLKLTVSGHLLIYVAHTKERWYRYLPSREVIIATTCTQIIATALALTGFLMPAAAPWQLVVFVWIWSFFFMQVSELVKFLRARPATAAVGPRSSLAG
jgi:H+-transporting ATPase